MVIRRADERTRTADLLITGSLLRRDITRRVPRHRSPPYDSLGIIR
jgi:hypothetical protein